MQWVGESSSGRLALEPVPPGHVAAPDPHAVLEVWMDAGGPGPPRGSEASAVSSGLPFLRDSWRLWTHPQTGNGSGAVDVAPPHQRAAEEGGLRPVRPVPDGGALREVRAAYGCLGQEEAGEAAAVGLEGACRYSVAGILTPTAARQDPRSYP